jgi:Ca-activated chloride channel family protein
MQTARGILRLWIAAASVALAAAGALAQSLENDRGGPMEIRSLSATATVEGRAARVVLDEVFFNPGPRDVEATYVLPLPEGAAVDGFSMWVDGVETQGELVDSRRGRGVYEGIVRSRRDPGLLETDGGRTFRTRVFPVPGRGEKRIRIRWTEVLRGDAGSATWRLPLLLAGSGAMPIGRASVVVDVSTERALASAWSPTHRVDVARADGRHARVSWEGTAVRPERDFVLVLQEPAGELGFSLLASRPGEGEGTFLLVLSPAVEEGAKPVPRDVVLCLDTSGSMAGKKIEQAKGALRYAVRTLSPEDRFSVVGFATEPHRFREGLVPATEENVAAALAFVDGLAASGGTAIDDALRASLGMLVGGDAARPAVVLFLTDGLPTVGEADPPRILAQARASAPERARVFTFGVGNDVDTRLLDSLAADLRGARDYVAPEEDIEAKVSALVAKTLFPVLTDLALEVEGVAVSGVYPRRLPDLFRGSELVVAGRYAGPGEAVVRVRARGRDGERLFERKVLFPEKAAGAEYVDRLWAVRRVGHLLDEMRLHGRSQELSDEVASLARRHGIVTPGTSYLVLEPGADRQGLFAAADEEAEVQDRLGDPRYAADTPFEGEGFNGNIGVGGGAGGAFQGRRTGRRNPLMAGGAATEVYTEAGLEWLKTRIPGPDAGSTAMTLLPFLGYGETHKTPRYGAIVRNGLKSLKMIQDAEGRFGPRVPGSLRSHALATLAMAEAYGLTMSPLFKTSAQNAVSWLVDARRPDGGWGTEPREGALDLLTTAWALNALRSARGAGLSLEPKELLEAAWDRVEKIVDKDTGRVGSSRTETAASGLARLFGGCPADDPLLLRTADALLTDPPAETDAEGWMFATTFLYQVGGGRWETWNGKMRALVLERQRQDRQDPLHGTWNPADPDDVAARTRDTALFELCLEVYYRYARVFGTRAPEPPPSSFGPRDPLPESPSGADAVRASLEAKRLSEASSADAASGGRRDPSPYRTVGTATFEFRKGKWWDMTIGADEPRTVVRSGTVQWYALAGRSSTVERWLELAPVVLRWDEVVYEVD